MRQRTPAPDILGSPRPSSANRLRGTSLHTLPFPAASEPNRTQNRSGSRSHGPAGNPRDAPSAGLSSASAPQPQRRVVDRSESPEDERSYHQTDAAYRRVVPLAVAQQVDDDAGQPG